MARIETWYNQDLQEPVKVHYLDGNVFSADVQGNVIGVRVTNNGTPYTLSGTVLGNIIRSDGVTVPVTGVRTGNQATIALPAQAYAVPGVISIIVKLIDESDTTTICAVVANVYVSSTDAVVDPGTIIPSVEALIEEIQAAVAEIPQDYTSFYFGFRRYLNSGDDVFELLPGGWGISPSASNKPQNLPVDFPSTAAGYVAVLEIENGTANMEFCCAAYSRRVWVRTGYAWEELAKESFIYENFVPMILNAACGRYTKGTASASTKTQSAFLDERGVVSVTGYSDWYVTDEIAISPNTLYVLTASAQYNGHWLYGIYDAAGDMLANSTATSGDIKSVDGMLLFTPNTAATIRISSVTGSDGAAIYTAQPWDALVQPMSHIGESNYAKGTLVESNKTQFRYLESNGENTIGDSYTDWYVTRPIPVQPFTFYCITASQQYTHCYYVIYDADGNVVYYEYGGSSASTIEDKIVFMPYNAASIQIASISGASGAALYTTVEKGVTQKWVGKKWVCIGDSLTANNIRTTMHYHDYIADETGITVVNLGEGGTGYKREYAGEGAFITRVDQIPLDADVVTIFGSGNDAIYQIGDPSDTGTDSLCSAINATIAAIFARKVTCQLGIVTPCPWESYNPADETNWMARYSAAIVEICKRWGIPCLDLYHCSNLRPWDAAFRAAAYSKDDGGGVHPDETGHAIIAPRFEAFLESLLLH